MGTHHAWTASEPGVGLLEEKDPPQGYIGRHSLEGRHPHNRGRWSCGRCGHPWDWHCRMRKQEGRYVYRRCKGGYEVVGSCHCFDDMIEHLRERIV
jgi:hypothetical protein